MTLIIVSFAPFGMIARTHYALNNATIGAPNLSRKAYQGDTIRRTT